MSKYYYKKYETTRVYADAYTTYDYYGSSAGTRTFPHGKIYTLGATYTASSLTTETVESMLRSNTALDSTGGFFCPNLTEVTDTSYTVTPQEGFIVCEDTQLSSSYPGYELASLIVLSNFSTTRGSKTLSTLQSAGNRYAYDLGCLQNLMGDGAGTYIGEVIAEDGTYPDEGKGDDGYWYVKDRLAVEFKARIDGAWVTTEPYVRVDGVWVKADVHPRVDGAWVG